VSYEPEGRTLADTDRDIRMAAKDEALTYLLEQLEKLVTPILDWLTRVLDRVRR
jgi:hypothetical protein